ncbi:ornithine carbamoyltransferase [Spirochaetota bacterium]
MIGNKKDLLTLADYTRDEIELILKTAADLKKIHIKKKADTSLKNKVLGMIFNKSSTRTRVSFEVGMYQLGGNALFLSKNDIQLGRGEPIADTGRVLERYLDGIMIRTFSQDEVRELAENTSIPVINGLTDLYHPCQVLSDLFTIREKRGRLEGIRLAYVGDGNNMANSIAIASSIMNISCAIASPPSYEVAQSIRDKTSPCVVYTNDAAEAAENADVLYTDVWASMGHEDEALMRKKAFTGYQISAELASKAKNDYIFLHCLPAHRGEEVSSEVIDSTHSMIFDQAENRLHTQKAVLKLLL